MLHLKKAPLVFLMLFEKLFPTQAVRGAVGGQETKWAGKSEWQHITIICIATYSSFVKPQAQEPKFYISLCCTHCKSNIRAEWNVDFEFLFCYPLSVRLDITMRYQRLKTPIYPKTQFSFVFHTFLGTNTGLPPLSLSRSTTSLSHFLWPWSTTTPWSSGGLLLQQNITSSSPPSWNSKPD